MSRDQKCPPWNVNCQNLRLCTRRWKINWRKKTLIWPNDLNLLTSIRWLDLISLLKLLLSLHTSVCSHPLTAGFPQEFIAAWAWGSPREINAEIIYFVTRETENCCSWTLDETAPPSSLPPYGENCLETGATTRVKGRNWRYSQFTITPPLPVTKYFWTGAKKSLELLKVVGLKTRFS